MMFGDDRAYWQHRAQQERERAKRSDSPPAREVHRELAVAYEARLMTAGADRRAVG